ncbi:glycosyltransferase family 2 protein [Gemella sp. GH3]|uniref:glycosyltransferase family 2 protein n=1 Tax=unclassified Gemella TaxID=2624949 RepID=UPI0015D0BC15|nr:MULTISPECIES: glycosyltransferase family A protein [unclassified Gemella]MBF0713852.1 glycosyltransferase family 2 protein [Gemella sp. GH3.1]NYS50804.1 glycosyltransferase family 2 protein [Gemella sp. GH3]
MISVIIPCYNCEHSIRNCYNSILNQSYKNIEIIFVNDGSTDNTLSIIKEIEKENKKNHIKIQIINQDNKGVSNARNSGLEMVNGKYISFIDSDDYVDANFFSTLIEQFDYNEFVDMSVVGVLKSSEKLLKKDDKIIILNKEEFLENVFFNKQVKGYTWNKLFKNSLIKENNIKFKEDITIMEDLEFCINYLQFCNLFSISNKQLYHYIIEESSAMNSTWNKNKMTVIKTFDYIKNINGINKHQRNLILLDEVRSFLWLLGQLYRTGSKEDLKKNEKIIWEKLKENKINFILKGYKCGFKYYIPYLLFLIHPKLLEVSIKLK